MNFDSWSLIQKNLWILPVPFDCPLRPAFTYISCFSLCPHNFVIQKGHKVGRNKAGHNLRTRRDVYTLHFCRIFIIIFRIRIYIIFLFLYACMSETCPSNLEDMFSFLPSRGFPPSRFLPLFFHRTYKSGALMSNKRTIIRNDILAYPKGFNLLGEKLVPCWIWWSDIKEMRVCIPFFRVLFYAHEKRIPFNI